jgi:hypothetical protein
MQDQARQQRRETYSSLAAGRSAGSILVRVGVLVTGEVAALGDRVLTLREAMQRAAESVARRAAGDLAGDDEVERKVGEKNRLSEASEARLRTYAGLAELDRLLLAPAPGLGGGEVGLGLVGCEAANRRRLEGPGRTTGEQEKSSAQGGAGRAEAGQRSVLSDELGSRQLRVPEQKTRTDQHAGRLGSATRTWWTGRAREGSRCSKGE